MKKLYALFVLSILTSTLYAQDIVNTLGASGSFKVNKSDNETMLKLNNFGQLFLGGGGLSSAAFNSRQFNIVQEGSSAAMTMTSYSNGNSSRSRIDFIKANGTIASPTALADGDELGWLNFYGYDGNSFQFGAGIEVNVDGTVSPGNMPLKFSFKLDNTERMTINKDGDVIVNGLNGTGTSNLEVDANGKLIRNNGSVSQSVTFNVGDSYTANENDYTIIPQNTIGPIALSLPDPATCTGRVYVVKHDGNAANDINISSNGTGIKIDGNDTVTLNTAWEFITIQSTGATWIIIGGNGYVGS